MTALRFSLLLVAAFMLALWGAVGVHGGGGNPEGYRGESLQGCGR